MLNNWYQNYDGSADDLENNCSKGIDEFEKVLKYYDNI